VWALAAAAGHEAGSGKSRRSRNSEVLGPLFLSGVSICRLANSQSQVAPSRSTGTRADRYREIPGAANFNLSPWPKKWLGSAEIGQSALHCTWLRSSSFGFPEVLTVVFGGRQSAGKDRSGVWPAPAYRAGPGLRGRQLCLGLPALLLCPLRPLLPKYRRAGAWAILKNLHLVRVTHGPGASTNNNTKTSWAHSLGLLGAFLTQRPQKDPIHYNSSQNETFERFTLLKLNLNKGKIYQNCTLRKMCRE
jgi:hypothetical protein